MSQREDHEDWESECREILSERNKRGSGSGSGNRIGRDGESVVCGLETESVRQFGLGSDLAGSDRGGFASGLVGWVNGTVSGP